MATEDGEMEDGIEFTIGSPSEPVPQSALQDRYMSVDKGVSYDEVDYRSELFIVYCSNGR